MLNQVVLVGRLVSDPELRQTDEKRPVTTIRLAIQRPFKSGETNDYETDFINCTLWAGIAEATVEHCHKGAIIGVKARLQQKDYLQDGKKIFSYPEVIAEKISFISKGKEEKM
ncbi:MAG: single-stranded DNA-binding protein [Candidatus Izemoplasmatales bacterium]|nr:single-stranded DNA-binding protein [Candidatus Izemoplasmatales bacterium]